MRGNPLFAKSGFPRTPSGKKSYMAGGITNAGVRRDWRSPSCSPFSKGGTRGGFVRGSDRRLCRSIVIASGAKQSPKLRGLPVGRASCPSFRIDRRDACPTNHSSTNDAASHIEFFCGGSGNPAARGTKKGSPDSFPLGALCCKFSRRFS